MGLFNILLQYRGVQYKLKSQQGFRDKLTRSKQL